MKLHLINHFLAGTGDSQAITPFCFLEKKIASLMEDKA